MFDDVSLETTPLMAVFTLEMDDPSRRRTHLINYPSLCENGTSQKTDYPSQMYNSSPKSVSRDG